MARDEQDVTLAECLKIPTTDQRTADVGKSRQHSDSSRAEQMMVEGFLDEPVRVRLRVGNSFFIVDSKTSATSLLIRDLDGRPITAIHAGPCRPSSIGYPFERVARDSLAAAEKERF